MEDKTRETPEYFGGGPQLPSDPKPQNRVVPIIQILCCNMMWYAELLSDLIRFYA